MIVDGATLSQKDVVECNGGSLKEGGNAFAVPARCSIESEVQCSHKIKPLIKNVRLLGPVRKTSKNCDNCCGSTPDL